MAKIVHQLSDRPFFPLNRRGGLLKCTILYPKSSLHHVKMINTTFECYPGIAASLCNNFSTDQKFKLKLRYFGRSVRAFGAHGTDLSSITRILSEKLRTPLERAWSHQHVHTKILKFDCRKN